MCLDRHLPGKTQLLCNIGGLVHTYLLSMLVLSQYTEHGVRRYYASGILSKM